MYIARLTSVAVDRHTGQSDAGSEFKGCEESIDNCMSQSTAMPNMILKYVCGLSVTFPTALIILTSLFLFFSPMLSNQAENLNCNTLLTKLSEKVLFLTSVSMAHIVCVVCVCVCFTAAARYSLDFSLSALCHSSLCSRVSESREMPLTSVSNVQCVKVMVEAGSAPNHTSLTLTATAVVDRGGRAVLGFLHLSRD